jgi:hypothetical protein
MVSFKEQPLLKTGKNTIDEEGKKKNESHFPVVGVDRTKELLSVDIEDVCSCKHMN